SKGATQELAIACGRGDVDAARHGLNLAHTINTLTSCLYALILAAAGLAIGLRAEGPWSMVWAVGLTVIGALAVVQRHVTFQVTILRAKQAFGVTARLQLLEATLTLVVSAAAIWLAGLWGLFSATLCVLLASWAFVRRTGAEPLHMAWDWPEIRRLIALGGPILLAGVASSLFRSLDKLMILGYLADREYQLGCYSVALMVGTQLYGLGNMISTVMGPRYCELLGRTGSVAEVARLAARASQLQAALLSLPAALAIVVAPPVLLLLLPDYHEGLAPLVWLIPGVMAVAMALPCSQCLVAVGRGQCVLVVLLTCAALAALGNHQVLSNGGGLTAVAQVMTAANIGYLVILAALSLWPYLPSAERAHYVVLIASTLGGCLLLSAVAHANAAAAIDVPTACWAALVLFGIWLIGMLLGWRYGGWSAACRHGRPAR
ncbi:MAG TPA: oligosaccharide flippase family protein, partial [Castellaniella sp.]|nr:oligosaccharide flippase family protein [Castellaniella sp.]